MLLDARSTLAAGGRTLRMVNLRDPGRLAIEVLGLTEHLGVTTLPSMVDGRRLNRPRTRAPARPRDFAVG